MDTRKIAQDYRMNKWINLIQECHDSGDGVRAWCRNNGIKTNSYYYWLRKIRVAACKALPSPSNQQQIVPIEMPKSENLISSDSVYVSSETSSADIVIRLGEAVVEIHNTASNTLIESTLRFLKNDR